MRKSKGYLIVLVETKYCLQEQQKLVLVSRSFIQQVLQNGLHLFLYSLQIVQKHLESNYEGHIEFLTCA